MCSSLQRDQYSTTIGIEFKKKPSMCTNFMKFKLFRKKGHFSFKFREIQDISQIVLHNCG